MFGWVVLGEAVRAIPAERGGAAHQRKAAMGAAYALVWGGFIAGGVALYLALSGPFQEVALPGFWGPRLLGPFPYMPILFAPVACATAAVFGLGIRLLPSPRGGPVALAGVAILVLLSGAGLGLQLLGLFPAWAYFLAGSLGFGYLVLGMAWRVPEARGPTAGASWSRGERRPHP